MTIDELIAALQEKRELLGGDSVVYLDTDWLPEFDVTYLKQHEINGIFVIDEGEIGLTIEQYIPIKNDRPREV